MHDLQKILKMLTDIRHYISGVKSSVARLLVSVTRVMEHLVYMDSVMAVRATTHMQEVRSLFRMLQALPEFISKVSELDTKKILNALAVVESQNQGIIERLAQLEQEEKKTTRDMMWNAETMMNHLGLSSDLLSVDGDICLFRYPSAKAPYAYCLKNGSSDWVVVNAFDGTIVDSVPEQDLKNWIRINRHGPKWVGIMKFAKHLNVLSSDVCISEEADNARFPLRYQDKAHNAKHSSTTYQVTYWSNTCRWTLSANGDIIVDTMKPRVIEMYVSYMEANMVRLPS